MKRMLPPALFSLILIFITFSGIASATTYYIAANGSDSNNGSKASPWLHAPGMKGCSNSCASTNPQPGDQFIFRGGDTWHYSAGSPVGLPWTWKWSGSSGNPIYIGVDTNWSASGTWSRPVLTMDNPLSTGQPSSCAYDDNNSTAATLSGVSYVTFDNFEFTGKCWGGNPVGAYLWTTGTSHIKVSNNYFHGWTMASTASGDTHYMIGGPNFSTQTGSLISDNVIDGSDSTFGNVCNSPTCVASTWDGMTSSGSRAATGWAINGDCYEVARNVIRHVSNGLTCAGMILVHDNLFEYIFEPLNNSPHGNVVESLGGIAGSTTATYNNIFRNFNVGQGIQPLGDHQYIFNNVFENDQHFPPDPNCIFIAPSIFASGGINGDVHVVNNTVDNTCAAQIFGGNTWTKHFTAPSTFEFGNNHILGRSSISGFLTIGSGASGTMVDDGGEVFQSLSTANSQGYTLANNFQPSSGNGATVGAGNSISSSCSAFSTDDALCSGTGDGSMEGTQDVAVFPVIPMVQRGSAWDAGAYEFGAAGTKPNPPSGLAAVVQ